MKLSQLVEMAKIDDAVTLYKQHVIDQQMPSRDFIALLMKSLNMTKAGATTYAYNAKKKWEQLIATSTVPSAPTTAAQPKQTPVQHPTQRSVQQSAPSAPIAQSTSGLTPEQEKWLVDHGITRYSFNQNGEVDVDGDVHVLRESETELPVKFGTINGDFMCSASEYTSLKNTPHTVRGDFFFNHAQLSSVAGGPQTVENTLCYSGNTNITSLEGATPIVGEHLYLTNMTSLKSLQGIHKQIRQMNGIIDLDETPIESHILGVLMIRGCREIKKLSNSKVAEIINKHLKGDRDVHLCQDELIDAGFAQFARL